MKIADLYQVFVKSTGIVIDSRKVQQNDFFVAIKGDNFDANTFAKQALDQGALCVVIDNANYYIDQRTILVEDSLKTLQELANYHRRQLNTPIIALTGSNGKTTTKELIQVVLAQKFNTKATLGNLNNHIGVPLTLLSFDKQTQIGIVEMGANHQKEIEFLCSIAEPNYGYITNFGKAHLEGFGGFEGVIKGKSELYSYFTTKKESIVFINRDDTIQVEKSENLTKFSFSFLDKKADTYIQNCQTNPFVKLGFEDTEVHSRLIGAYNATNIAAAITIGTYFEVGNSQIKKAIEDYIPTNNRSQLLEKNSNKIILDAYNANPSSMKAAIENFTKLDVPDKLMILGDMFELGKESIEEHKNIVELIEREYNSSVFFVGKDFCSSQKNNEKLQFFENFDTLKAYLSENKITNKTILIKGSRGMALERSLDVL